jgi:hypothetical protein
VLVVIILTAGGVEEKKAPARINEERRPWQWESILKQNTTQLAQEFAKSAPSGPKQQNHVNAKKKNLLVN